MGFTTVIAFLITGQFMRHHSPPMAALTAATRLMYRSRHIYILAAGLLNLMLGVYFQPCAKGRRRGAQIAGSALLIAAPVFLMLAFVIEPGQGFYEAGWWSHAGLYALFGGSMLHLIGARNFAA
jgi:hypothetical protein